MKDHQRQFLESCLAQQALRFGDFTLKSGRQSPYFFNAGQFASGRSLRDLGRYYVQALDDAGLEFDMLFGPAYKGIALAAAIAIAYADLKDRDLPWAYNRKEAKDHGEGGQLVGAPLRGRVLVVDDVISAGTSARESAQTIARSGAQLAGLVIALDRQERGSGERSATAEVEQVLGAPVVSIATLDTLIAFLGRQPGEHATLERMQAYRARYGVPDESAAD